MHARVTRAHGDPSKVDEGIERFKSTSLPAIKQIDGLKGILYLVDKKGAKVAAVSLWESEEALNAGDAAVQKIRSDALQAGSAEVDSTEVYEVIVQDLG